MSDRTLVLDANILIGAILGRRIPVVLGQLATSIELIVPAIAYEDARRHLPNILTSRTRHSGATVEETQDLINRALGQLQALEALVRSVPIDQLSEFEAAARRRIAQDPDDWPMVALALQRDAPLWTEDTDFFGTGIATWRTATVHIVLDL